MAQLPPKTPAMAPAWPEFGGGHHHHAHHHQQRSPSVGTFLAAPMPPQQPTWVEEFLDFTAAKRGAHRRTVSDSVAFLEPGPDDGNAGDGAHDFDRLDDDQLLSMFSDDLPPPPPPQQQATPAPAPVASSSSPSDHNSINDEKTDRAETEEAQSKCHGDAAAAPGQPASAAAVDPKRFFRPPVERTAAQKEAIGNHSEGFLSKGKREEFS